MKRLDAPAGSRFGRLVLIGVSAKRTSDNRTLHEFRCDCGASAFALLKYAIAGATRSCGCLRSELVASRAAQRNRTHGMSDRPEWHIWSSLRRRCFDLSHPHYGGRGIQVCERWANSFEAFLEDMGPRPTARHSIDRIDNNGNYEPSNCRWATATQQCRNTRVNRLLPFNGEMLCLADVAERVGISSGTLAHRLGDGWSIEDALNTPVRRMSRKAHKGVSHRMRELAGQTGLEI